MKKVEVWLYQTSEPLVHMAKSTYVKGPLYCVYEGERVFKYPVMHIFRIIEDYGTHGGETLSPQKQQRENDLIKRLIGPDGGLSAAKIIQ